MGVTGEAPITEYHKIQKQDWDNVLCISSVINKQDKQTK